MRVAAVVDAFGLGGLTVALVGLTVDKHRLDEKVEQIAALPEVTWAAVVTGRYDIMAEVVTEDGMQGLYDFLNVSLREVGGIKASEMFVVMKAHNRWMVLPRGPAPGVDGAARGLRSFQSDSSSAHRLANL